MSVNPPPESSAPAGCGAFAATQWSLVLTAAGDDTRAAAALARLCAAYWDPLYAFARRLGLTPHDGEDAVQGFFAHLLEKSALAAVDRGRGRFRSFLLAAFKNFLSHERERAAAQKRGGGTAPLALDALAAEERYALEPADELSPDKLFDRRWALTVLERAQVRLRDEYAAMDKAALFDALRPMLIGSQPAPAYAELAGRLAMSEGALKVAAHRLRERYRAVLRAEVAETVATAAEIDEELRQLISAL